MYLVKKLRYATVFAVLLALTMVFSACGSETKGEKEAKEDKDTVVIGTLNSVNAASVLIGKQEKWFENELGMKVKILSFDSGKDVIAAMASNSIDIGYMGSPSAAIAISNHIDADIIWVASVIGTGESLIAKKNSGISRVKDLAGKKVATPFASTAHFSLINALKLEGMSESDIKLIDMKTDDIFAAWQRNDIDAAYVWYPVLEELLRDGVSITDSEKLAEKGYLTSDVVMAGRNFSEQHPEVVEKFISLLIRGDDMINRDPALAAKKVGAFLDISEQDVAKQMTQFKYPTVDEEISYLDKTVADQMKDTADFLVEQKSIKTAPSMEEIQNRITSKFVKAASKQ